MAQSGNTVALKSFQSYMVNEGLLAKTVEAIKAGEKEARSTGNVQSFEVFYKGFRQNIAIGRIYIVPPSVVDKKGQNFPTALLYGCIVRTWGGEEVSDMISHKIGDSEWDEYSQADYDTIKKKLFQDEDGKEGKLVALVIYAPNWLNKREYQGFQFSSDDNQLTNLTRHVVFSSYFDPRLSSAFDAMMTDVETSKFDVTDITPKMNFPALAENPLKEFPLLTKEGSSKKPRLALTFKTADEVTKEVLEPQEMDVFDSLDQALRNSLLPTTEDADKAGEQHDQGFKAPDDVPRVASVECDKCDGDGCKFCNNKGTKKAGEATAVFETPITNVGPGTEAAEAGNQRTKGYIKEKDVPKAVINSAPIGIALDDTGVARRPEEQREKSATKKVAHGYIAFYGGKRIEIQADSLYGAKLKAIEMLKVPKSKQGLLAVELAEKDGEQVTTTITSADKQAKRVDFTSTADVARLGGKASGDKIDLSASASAALEGARMGSKEALEKHADNMMEYAASMSQDNQAHHAVADHQKDIAAGKYGDNPLSMSASLKKVAYVAHVPGHKNSKGEAAPWVIKQHNTDKILESFKSEQAAKDGLKNMESHKGSKQADDQNDAAQKTNDATQAIEKAWRAKSQGADAIADHNASFDASKWGGLGMKQASSLWAGTARKVADQFDQFTRGYIETALWSTNDESDPSGGVPLDENYDIRDLSPSALQAMTQDCEKFQNENRELLDAAWNQDGQDAFRQGHDFWLTRCGHGAGYWDGDYPTSGDGLTEASKSFGDVDLYVGDDDLIYQMGSEHLAPSAPEAQPPTTASKKTAAVKTASSYVSSLIAGGVHVDGSDARSQRSKSAAEKREEEMQRKYGSQRRKLAGVPQTEEDIWSESMDNIGPAPEIRLPGETEDNAKSTEGDHEINAPDADASLWSDTPEIERGNQEEPTVEFEEALENSATESTEPEPSTGEGGAGAETGETSEESEGESEEKSEGGSKSEWAKNRGKSKSEPKEEAEAEEPKEESEEGESKEASAKTADEPLETSTIETMEPENYEATQKELLDTGYAEECPSCGAISAYSWDDANYCENCTEPMGLDIPEKDRIYHIGAASGYEWECGKCRNSWTPADSPLTAEVYTHNDPNAEFDIESSQLDAQLSDKQATPVLDQAVGAPAVFYECGSCGGVHPSMATSEKLGLGWNGDCRDEHGSFQESDIPYEDDTVYISLEEQMAPDFDDSILASAEEKTAGDDFDFGEAVASEDDMNYFASDEKTADTADNPANEDGGEGAIEVKTDADIKNTHGTTPKFDVTGGKTAKMGKCRKCKKDRSLNNDKVCHECEQAERDSEKEASAKTADTADNPVEMKGGEGAVVDKKDSVKADTSGPAVKNTAAVRASVVQIKYAGKSTTPKYVIRVNVPGHYTSDASWDVNSRGQLRGAGKPNDANLAKYMEQLLKSLQPGGSNEHLKGWNPETAAVYHNDGTYKNPLAQWKAEAKPMFEVKEGAGGRSKERLAELAAIIKPELISIENGAEPQYDDDGKIKEDIATCGNCGMSWNDALITERTPAPSARCPYEYIHPEIMEYKSIAKQLRQPQQTVAADVSGDMAEAKSEIVSPDTVDTDIKQPTVSVDEAGKQAAGVEGDIAEAKSEVGYNKAEVADEAQATNTENPDHFAAAPAMALEGGEFPFVETLVGMGWDDTGDPGHFMKDNNRVEVLTYSDGYEVYVDGELYESGDNVDELHNTLEIVDELGIDALNAHQAAYGDEEDEERPIDLGLGDLADLVVEDEDAN